MTIYKERQTAIYKVASLLGQKRVVIHLDELTYNKF